MRWCRAPLVRHKHDINKWFIEVTIYKWVIFVIFWYYLLTWVRYYEINFTANDNASISLWLSNFLKRDEKWMWTWYNFVLPCQRITERSKSNHHSSDNEKYASQAREKRRWSLIFRGIADSRCCCKQWYIC